MAAASGAGEKTGATLFLETKNRIVEQYMYEHLLGEDPAEHAQFVVGDFDDTTIQISSSKKTDPTVFTCHIDAPYIAQIKAAGAFEPAATALEKYLVASDSGVTLQVDSAALPEDARVVVDTFAAIKHHVAGAPYKHLLTHLQAGTSVSLTPFCVNFKGTETTYFLPGPDRVMFAFGMQFPDPTDAALVRVLCQQFADVQRTMGAAPAVSVCELGATGQTIPREITDSGLPLLTEGGEGFSGYIALTFFQGHVDDATKLANTLTLAATFRTYITYHLKAAKSYIHSRMRNRVDSLLQVLKRAHTSDPTKPKVKKGFSGKTLKQRL